MKSGTFLLIIGVAAFVITYLVLNWIGIEENSGSIGVAVALLAVAIVAYKRFVNPDSNTTAKRHGPFYWDDKKQILLRQAMQFLASHLGISLFRTEIPLLRRNLSGRASGRYD